MTTEQISRLLSRRILTAAAVAMAILVPSSQWANATDDDPFGNSVKVADAALDNLRGGYETNTGVFFPAGLFVGLDRTANGRHIAGATITNHMDPHQPVQVSTDNLGIPINVGPAGPGATTIMTTLAPQGIMTVIQNNRPNITLQTQGVLTVKITGMQNLIRTSVPASHFNGRGFFH